MMALAVKIAEFRVGEPIELEMPLGKLTRKAASAAKVRSRKVVSVDAEEDTLKYGIRLPRM